MREQDKKIAEWIGWTEIHLSNIFHDAYAKLNPTDINRTYVKMDFTTSDADAISLLPVLVEKDWWVNLSNTPDGWRCMVHKGAYGEREVFTSIRPTIASAISWAILQLIESEAKQ